MDQLLKLCHSVLHDAFTGFQPGFPEAALLSPTPTPRQLTLPSPFCIFIYHPVLPSCRIGWWGSLLAWLCLQFIIGTNPTGLILASLHVGLQASLPLLHCLYLLGYIASRFSLHWKLILLISQYSADWSVVDGPPGCWLCPLSTPAGLMSLGH